MKVLDLFSGIGGFSLGLERAGMETVAFCEIDIFCQKVLRKHWPNIPIHDDIRTLKGNNYGAIDVICGGFPCQPYSTAGTQRGREDNRDLWPEMFRVIREAQPTWVIGENVAGFINMEFERTANDLEKEGYEVQAFVIPACAVGAPHERKRIWIMAYSKSADDRRIARKICGEDGRQELNKLPEFSGTSQISTLMANTECKRSPRSRKFEQSFNSTEASDREANESFNGGIGDQWKFEPSVGRVVNGIPNGMDRLKGLGNAVVPQIPELIGRAILKSTL